MYTKSCKGYVICKHFRRIKRCQYSWQILLCMVKIRFFRVITSASFFCSVPSNTDDSRLFKFALKRDRLRVSSLCKLKVRKPCYILHILQLPVMFFFIAVSAQHCQHFVPPTLLICALKIDRKYKCHVDFVIRLRCAIEIPELSFRLPQIYPSASHITSTIHVRWRDTDASAGLVKGEQLIAAQLRGTTPHEFRPIERSVFDRGSCSVEWNYRWNVWAGKVSYPVSSLCSGICLERLRIGYIWKILYDQERNCL